MVACLRFRFLVDVDFFFSHFISFFFKKKCLNGYQIIKTFVDSFNIKRSCSETFETARGIAAEIEFASSDFCP